LKWRREKFRARQITSLFSEDGKSRRKSRRDFMEITDPNIKKEFIRKRMKLNNFAQKMISMTGELNNIGPNKIAFINQTLGQSNPQKPVKVIRPSAKKSSTFIDADGVDILSKYGPIGQLVQSPIGGRHMPKLEANFDLNRVMSPHSKHKNNKLN
jgi:hypothetical protein